jgi:uncharacterized cupredoxin-like copper-binding protein
MRITAMIVAAAMPLWADTHDTPSNQSARAVVETEFGRTGDAKRITRTIRVGMSDAMRFTPADIQVKQGETIRFIVTNAGQAMHEMVLGTMQTLSDHARLMRAHPGMAHDEPYMVHVASGKTAAMIWQFTKAGEYRYGCLIPGHFEAGMVGRIQVVGK